MLFLKILLFGLLIGVLGVGTTVVKNYQKSMQQLEHHHKEKSDEPK